MKLVRILHQRTGELIAEGRVGLFGITPFEAITISPAVI